MILSNAIKQAIQQEYNSWVDCQYSGKDKKDRQKMSQFFTPPPLTIKMLEKFDSIENKTMLDPTIGAGGLIAAAIIAGANPRMCYGIELDETIANIARIRLSYLGVPRHHIHVGNALDEASYEFPESRLFYSLKYKNKNLTLDITERKTNNLKNSLSYNLTQASDIKNLHKILKRLIKSESECVLNEHLILQLNVLFEKNNLERI